MTLGPKCGGCPLQRIGSGYAAVDGTGRSGVVIVAEALGEDEARLGHNLVGKAGQFTQRMLTRTRDPETQQPLEWDDFYRTNIIRCRPPNNELTGASYEFGALAHCRPYLEDFLLRTRPKAWAAGGR